MGYILWLSLLLSAHGLDNGLGQLPGLGWNSDYCTNCSHPSGANGFGGEHFVAHIATYMATVKQQDNHTLQELGFHYVNMDASWDLPQRDANHQLVPDPALWPSGLPHTVSLVHSLGLGFGLYGDRGDLDCAKNPGNNGSEVSDATQYAGWLIDWYKTDSCYASGDHSVAVQEYGRMRDALNETGRPIWLALCGWQNWYAVPDPSIGYGGGNTLGNSWRTGPDTGTGWTAVIININNALDVAQYGGPGGWNDGSLQLTPGMGCHSPTDPLLPSDNCMSNSRFVTQYSAWCMLAMNLLLVGNFSALNPFVMRTWSNPELLAINQDPLGTPARRLNSTVMTAQSASSYQSAKMSECGGEPELQQWKMSPVGQLTNPASKSCLNVEGCKSSIIYDGCVPASAGCGPNEEFSLDSAGRLVSALPGSQCVTEGSDHTLHLGACSTSASQVFSFSNGRLLDASGLCLTASGAPSSGSHIVLGRPLSGAPDGKAAVVAGTVPGGHVAQLPGFGLMMVNNDVTSANITCGRDCLTGLGLDSSVTYQLRDVVARSTLGLIGGGHSFEVVAQLAAGGESRVLRLTPQHAESVF